MNDLGNLLQMIYDLLSGWYNSFTSHALAVMDKLNLIETDTASIKNSASDIKSNTDDIKDNTGAIVTPVQSIKTNTDSIKTDTTTIKNNVATMTNQLGTISTNVGTCSAYAEDVANNTLDIKDRIVTIGSDTTQIRSNTNTVVTDLDKVYEALKWSLIDKVTSETVEGNNSISFDTDLTNDLVELDLSISPTQSGTGDPTPDNVRPITGITDKSVIVNGNNITISLGQTVYSGILDILSGKLLIDMVKDTMTSSYLSGLSSSYIGFVTSVSFFNGHPAIWVRNWKTPPTCKGRVPGGIKSLCNAFTISMNNNDIISTQYRVYFDVNNLNITSVSDFITTIQNLELTTPLEIVYEVDTPIEVQLTPSQIATIKGINTISSDGTIKCTYEESIKHYLDKQEV